MAFLEVDDIATFYGNIQALKSVSLTVEEGECVTLIGSNGAGKSTTLRSISGLTPPRSGSIKLAGAEISMLPPQEIVGLGVCQSPEGRKCFQRMTVRENLELGAFLRRDSQGIEADLKRVFELFPRLAERRNHRGGQLSGGERQMLAVARALMIDPELILMDEPSEGLAPVMVQHLEEIVLGLKREKLSILLVEQNLYSALAVADRVYVMETGKIVHEASAAALAEQPELLFRHLGVQ